MNNPELQDYINSQITSGVTVEEIKKTLLIAGWKQEIINAAFSPANTIPGTPVTPISEKEYPISNRWMLEKSVSYILLIIFVTIVYAGSKSFYLNLIFFVIFYGSSLLYLYLSKRNFHYNFEGVNIVIHQGILNKKNNILPFAVVQNVFVKQGLMDRIFGISTLAIENASQGGGAGRFGKFLGMKFQNRNNKVDEIGKTGNKVSIPGLTKADAEKLKEIILLKIKENPNADTTSGI